MEKNITERNRNVHTNPDKAGIANFKGNENHLKKSDHPETLPNILKLKSLGEKSRKRNRNTGNHDKTYKGLWTEEELRDSIVEFFDTCADLNIKPTNVALCIWLGISKTQYYDWKADRTGNYGYKSVLLKEADLVFEQYLLSDIDYHTVGDIFLLKCKHDYVEKTKMDITSDGKALDNADELKEKIKMLGLDNKS